MTSGYRTKVMRSSQAFRLRSVVNSQLFYFCFVYILSFTPTGRLGRPILSPHKQLPFGVTMTTRFIKRSVPSKVQKFPVGLSGSRKSMNVFFQATKDQPKNIKYISNYAVYDGEEHLHRIIWVKLY